MYCIYMHKNKMNGKVYIGQTCQNPEDRWKKGQGYKSHNIGFYNDICLYSWDGFEHIILETELNAEQADEREAFYIDLFDSTNQEKGYNIYKQNYSHYHFSDLWKNEDIKKKIIEKLIKQRNTKEYQELQSKMMKEKWNNEDYRKSQKDSWTEERTNKAITTTSNLWKNNEYRDNISLKCSEKTKESWQTGKYNNTRKQVICIETGQLFNSVREAAEYAGIKSNSLSPALKDQNKSAGKHPVTKEKLHWKYVDNSSKQVTNKKIKVICLNTDEIFNSLRAASEWCGLKEGGQTIKACCLGKQKTAGAHPQTQERLRWAFYSDEEVMPC